MKYCSRGVFSLMQFSYVTSLLKVWYHFKRQDQSRDLNSNERFLVATSQVVEPK
jgi:hypothetical protein